MRYGIGSGALWGLDTVILAIALALNPFATDAHASPVSAALHDAICALILLIFMAVRGRLKDTWRAVHTRSGRAVMVAALLGGPIGMSGYLLAIDQIGAGYTAIISTFYPALGTALAVLVLKERMRPRQVIALAVAIGAIIATSYTSTSVSGSALWGVLGALASLGHQASQRLGGHVRDGLLTDLGVIQPGQAQGDHRADPHLGGEHGALIGIGDAHEHEDEAFVTLEAGGQRGRDLRVLVKTSGVKRSKAVWPGLHVARERGDRPFQGQCRLLLDQAVKVKDLVLHDGSGEGHLGWEVVIEERA